MGNLGTRLDSEKLPTSAALQEGGQNWPTKGRISSRGRAREPPYHSSRKHVARHDPDAPYNGKR